MKYGKQASQLPDQEIRNLGDVLHHILASHAKVYLQTFNGFGFMV